MTQFEEYQGKNQRLGYLIQLLTFFVTMNKSGANLDSAIYEKKIHDKIKQLANEEVKEQSVPLELA